jgi:uncharacterized protein (DUF983 family)
MFRAFLKVADTCLHCGEKLHHHRADDFPAYLVIVIVGHILVPIVLAVETNGLLQPIKGAVVAIQWYGGMHVR